MSHPGGALCRTSYFTIDSWYDASQDVVLIANGLSKLTAKYGGRSLGGDMSLSDHEGINFRI